MKKNGFKLMGESFVKEINSNARMYIHEKTNARLFHIKNDDTNKVFAVCFNTYPVSDNGVCHIIEHSVLSGSEKYPLKEPFVNLMKGSLNTFLNAMTLPDRTIYPVASQNDKDFVNLVDVYLDAVFNPLILKSKLAFLQEGWHMELDEDGNPFYTGVVLNEMKGAMSSADSVLNHLSLRELFDNVYHYNSGGSPESIIDLSYEEYLDFYKEHYHPSNANFFLYGNCEPDEVFRKLDEEYLSKFEKKEAAKGYKPASEIREPKYLNTSFSSKDGVNFAQITLNLGSTRDIKKNIAAQIISLALFGMEASPVRISLIESGLCKDVSCYIDDSKRYLTFSITLYDVSTDDCRQIEKTIYEHISSLAFEDIKDILMASLTNYSFNLRELDTENFPKGMVYCFKMLFGEDDYEKPFDKLSFEKEVEEIGEDIASGRIMQCIDEYILNNNYRVCIHLAADETLEEKTAEIELERAKKEWTAFSESEKQAKIKEMEELFEHQSKEDPPELIKLMPKLELEDLKNGSVFRDVKAQTLELSGKKHTLLHYEADTSGIMYVKLMFSLVGYSLEDISKLSLLASLLGVLGTKNYNYYELNNKTLSTFGGLTASVNDYADKLFFEYDFKLMPEKLKEGLELIEEILLNTKFDDDNMIENVIYSNFSRLQMAFSASGHEYASGLALCAIDKGARYSSAINGLDQYRYIKGLLDGGIDGFKAELSGLLKGVIARDNITIGYTGDESIKNLLIDEIKPFISSVLSGDGSINRENEIELSGRCQKAYVISAPVQFVAQCGELFDKKEKLFTGHYHVVKTLLNTAYLWNAIRVKGGAYGVGISFNRRGRLVVSSYRDPNCAQTLEAYKQIPKFLRSLELSDEDMLTLIIGSISSIDRPLSPRMEGENAIERYIDGVKAQELNRERKEVLETKASDIVRLADSIEKALNQNIYCVFGSENTLNDDKRIFESIEML